MIEKTAAEFFSGIGLVRWALDQCDWRSVFSNDNNPEKWPLYEQNFSNAEAVLDKRDIKDLHGDDIPDVGLATASFPCNDLSLAGSRNGLDGTQSSTFWHFIRILREMGSRKPLLVLLENVPGFLTSHKGEDFKRAMLALNELDYEVDPFMVNADRFAPQSRLRLFVVAAKNEKKNITGPELLKYDSEVRPPLISRYVFEHPEIRWRMRELPLLPNRERRFVDIVESDPPPAWWDSDRATYLLNQMSPKHFQIAQEMIRGNCLSYGTVFRRVRHGRSMAELRTDGVAGCLRTPRGGSGRQILFAAGFGQYFARLVTPRECARLQGVSENYQIDAPLNQALFGFGDAVCVPVVEWIAIKYLTPLFEELTGQTRVAAHG